MSLKYIRKHYGVPAKRGGRVRYASSNTGTMTGTITGSRDAALRVRFDGWRHTVTVHPTFQIEYLTTECGRKDER